MIFFCISLTLFLPLCLSGCFMAVSSMEQVLQSGCQRTTAFCSTLKMQLVSQTGRVKIVKRSSTLEARESLVQQPGLAGQAGTSLGRKASAERELPVLQPESQGRLH